MVGLLQFPLDMGRDPFHGTWRYGEIHSQRAWFSRWWQGVHGGSSARGHVVANLGANLSDLYL